jgi:hypothetical protein
MVRIWLGAVGRFFEIHVISWKPRCGGDVGTEGPYLMIVRFRAFTAPAAMNDPKYDRSHFRPCLRIQRSALPGAAAPEMCTACSTCYC